MRVLWFLLLSTPASYGATVVQCHPHIMGIDLTQTQGPPEVAVRLATPGKNETARLLKKVLDELGYDAAYRTLFGTNYKKLAIFDLHWYRDADARLAELEESGAITPRRALALKFFLLGHRLSNAEAKILIPDQATRDQLFFGLERLGYTLYAQGFSLNNLAISSYEFEFDGKKSVSYIMSDLPKRYQRGIIPKREPTAQIYGTSNRTLARLEAADFSKQLAEGKNMAADFGSGTGLLSIYLLQKYPELRMLGLEVDNQSMQLSEFNAMMSGVHSRFEPIDNRNKGAKLTQRLSGQKLAFAVSNPPFNQVPRRFSKFFTNFGDGGPMGTDVTEIFLQQAKDHLKPNGVFMFYSQLAQDKDGNAVIEKILPRYVAAGDQVRVESLWLPSQNRSAYSESMAMYLYDDLDGDQLQAMLDLIDGKAPKKALPAIRLKPIKIPIGVFTSGDVEKIAKAMEADFQRVGMEGVSPAVVWIEKGASKKVLPTLYSSFDLSRFGHFERDSRGTLGGIYLTQTTIPVEQKPGGVWAWYTHLGDYMSPEEWKLIQEKIPLEEFNALVEQNAQKSMAELAELLLEHAKKK